MIAGALTAALWFSQVATAVVANHEVTGSRANPFPLSLNTPPIMKTLCGQSSRTHRCPLKPNLHQGGPEQEQEQEQK